MVCHKKRWWGGRVCVSILLCAVRLVCISPDIASLTSELPKGADTTLVEETMMGQSLIAEQERIRSFQRPPLRVRLLSDHQDLLQMMGVLTHYFSEHPGAIPSRLESAWRELLTHSISDAAIVRGAQNNFVTAINEVVVSVADATEAVAKAVRACMVLLKQLSIYVGLSETRAAHRLSAGDRRTAYHNWREHRDTLHDFFEHHAVSRPKSFSNKALAVVVIAGIALTGGIGALWWLASRAGKRDAKSNKKSLAKDAVKRAGDTALSAKGEPVGMSTAERARWRQRTLTNVTPSLSSPSREEADRAAYARGRHPVPE